MKMKEKSYENKDLDKEIVISSRIRLARNLKKYPFSRALSNEKAKELIAEVTAAIKNERTFLSTMFEYIDLNKADKNEKISMLENHIISPELVNKTAPCGVLLKDDASVSILVNEEDHLRIQSVFSGYNIDKAWDMANKIDDLIEESVEYAFDKNYGYLTSCPTNTGTGLRASFMLHLPMLEKTERIRPIAQSLTKFGMTLRGIYGEGSEPLGSIYQVSNQITLGKSEEEIIESLKNLTTHIIEQEKALREEYKKNNLLDFQDMVYRAYGILKNCKKISSKEAMGYLSDVRLGLTSEILNIKPKANIYNVMMNIQSGNLQKANNGSFDENQRDEIRAKYLNDIL